MRRDFARLDATFDLLVVGGGVYGAWIAYDAALRGLSVALVEREDWAAGTSSASTKLIHGGLRYLEHGEVGLVAKALRERGRLMRLAPHRVRAQRFLLPLYRGMRPGRLPLAAGLRAYDLLAGARPDVAAHRAFASSELLARAPFLCADDLRGGFAYSDAAEDDARFTLELVAGALAAGACAVNHAEAVELLRAGGRVVGARVRDALSGATAELRASVVVDATGAWAARTSALALPVRHTKGVHLALPPLPHDDAFLLRAPRDGRVFFLIPWYGATLVGTTDTDWNGDPASVRPEPADVAYLLDAVAATCPGLGWGEGDVRASFAGLRTLRGAAGSPSSVSREWELLAPEPGLLLPLGGKFTSARVEAGHTVDRVQALRGRAAGVCPTLHRRFPWTPANWPGWSANRQRAGIVAGLDATTAATATRRYGRQVDRLHALLRARPELARRVLPETPFCLAETLLAVRDEMALTLRDVLRRRVPVLTVARPTAAALAEIAALVGAELGWDAARQAEQVRTTSASV